MRHVVLLLLSITIARVASAEPKSEARRIFESANNHYAVGEFKEAANEYEAAFKLKNDAALLYDAAQAHRLAGNHDKALILYRNYLILFPNEANAELVRAQMIKEKQVVATSETARTSAPTGTVDAGPLRPDATAATPATPTTTTTAPAPTPSEQRRPIYRQWWPWTILGVVVAGGVIAGAVIATRPHGTWTNLPDAGPSSKALFRW